jgi:hypothetical protein
VSAGKSPSVGRNNPFFLLGFYPPAADQRWGPVFGHPADEKKAWHTNLIWSKGLFKYAKPSKSQR